VEFHFPHSTPILDEIGFSILRGNDVPENA